MQVTEHFDIIIIGAGAAGLHAAFQLTQVKLGVLILEAQGRIGGRMYTNQPHGFSAPIESGAEFIHGDAPITMKLLKEAGAHYVEIQGNTFQAHDNGQEKKDPLDPDWDVLMMKLKDLRFDMTFADFLAIHFDDPKDEALRQNAKKFVEGYNAADVEKVSAMALRDEWSAEDDPAQYRITGGYQRVYEYLASKITAHGGVIRTHQKVTSLRWQKEQVQIVVGLNTYLAKKCLITVPAANLRLPSIEFIPQVPSVVHAAERIGFGSVIKISMEFKNAFWEDETPRKFKALQFLFSDEVIPTWWSQTPDQRPLLTGWLGGPQATQLNLSDHEILDSAMQSLSNAMQYPEEKIREKLIAWRVDQWVKSEFCIGAYSYDLIDTPRAVKVLQQSVHDTLFFAGEAIYDGPHKGTVEAALTSGADAAKRIIGGEK